MDAPDDITDALVSTLYDELQSIARGLMSLERRHGAGQTLQPTALVHEAWLRLGSDARWNSRAHFLGAAALAMRRILVERARRRGAAKRGGGAVRVELRDDAAAIDAPTVDLEALDEALDALETRDARKARVVQLRYFAGLTLDEIADLLGLSLTTVKADWTWSRLWLFAFIRDGERSR